VAHVEYATLSLARAAVDPRGLDPGEWERARRLVTPRARHRFVAVRSVLRAELAHRLGIPSREEAFTFAELPHVDELFLAGTTTDVTPVVRVDDLTIGSGKPGPISLRLLKELRTHIDASCAAVSA